MNKLRLTPLIGAVGLCLGLAQPAWAATYTMNFSGFTATAGPPTTVGGLVVNAAASGVNVNMTPAASPATLSGAALVGPGTGAMTVTLTFSSAVSGLKIAVRNVAFNYLGNADEYLHSFTVNGSPISLPSQSVYAAAPLLVQTSVAGGSGIAPSATPAYTGNNSDSGGAYLLFPGSNITSASFVVQGNSSIGIDTITFDYPPASAPVNAPVDLRMNKQPETFATEIEVK